MTPIPERTIKLVRALSEAERQTLEGWGTNIFGADHFSLKWRPKDRHFLCYEQGELVSKVSLLKHEVYVEGHPIDVGGIGGVVTVPSACGRGHATALLQHTAAIMRDELAVPFGLLFCLETLAPFYERLGWQRVSQAVLIDHLPGKIICPMNTMTLACRRQKWPAGLVDLRSQPW